MTIFGEPGARDGGPAAAICPGVTPARVRGSPSRSADDACAGDAHACALRPRDEGKGRLGRGSPVVVPPSQQKLRAIRLLLRSLGWGGRVLLRDIHAFESSPAE